MSWVNIDHHFDGHAAVFFIPQKAAMMDRIVFGVLAALNDHPDKLEAALLDLLAKFRPELAGCVVYSMHFNHDYGRWEFYVSHGSLPRRKSGQKVKAVPLDPALEREHAEVLT